MADRQEASERLYERLRRHGAERDEAKRTTARTEDRSSRRTDNGSNVNANRRDREDR